MPYKREPEFVDISPKALIPAIRIGERGFCESLIVVEFIDEYFDTERKLLVGDCVDRAQQRQIVDHGWFHLIIQLFQTVPIQHQKKSSQITSK